MQAPSTFFSKAINVDERVAVTSNLGTCQPPTRGPKKSAHYTTPQDFAVFVGHAPTQSSRSHRKTSENVVVPIRPAGSVCGASRGRMRKTENTTISS